MCKPRVHNIINHYAVPQERFVIRLSLHIFYQRVDQSICFIFDGESKNEKFLDYARARNLRITAD